jgi:diguanylate cyclase (GGDEF)-like protein
MKLQHRADSLTDLNQLINHLNNARTWKQLVDQLLSWLKDYSDCSACGYINILPGSEDEILWIRNNPRGKWFTNADAIEIVSLIPIFSAENKPYLTFEQSDSVSPQLSAWMQKNEFESVIVLPVLSNKDIIGLCLIAFSSRVEDELFAHPFFIQTLSLFFSNFAHWQSKYDQAEAKITEMDHFIQAGLELTASLNLEETLNTILENALSLTPKAHDAHIFLYEDNKIQFGAAMFQDGASGKVWANPREDGLTYTVAKQAKMIVIQDMAKDPLYQNAPSDWKGSIIGIPLLNQKTVVGVMTMAKLTPFGFTGKEIANLQHLAGQAANVIRNIRTYDRISLQAYTDPLTNLPNRRAFEGESLKILENFTRYNRQFCIAMLDLNGFKRINDSYGHTSGDRALRQIAECIKQSIRKTDILARYGGDEFIVLLPETDLESATMVMEKLINTIESCDIQINENQIEKLSLSYGLSLFPETSQNLDELIAAADQHLYKNKAKIKRNS